MTAKCDITSPTTEGQSFPPVFKFRVQHIFRDISGCRMMQNLSWLMASAIVQIAWSQSPNVTVTEGIIVGKTVEFSETVFINKTVDVDVFLVS